MLAAFTTRHGGFSRTPYKSLNLGLHVDDDAAAVKSNRLALASALDFDAGRLVFSKQIHGSKAVTVAEPDAGAGAFELDSAIDGADALITTSKRLPLAILTADCVPVILVAPEQRIIAAVHAGWRGTLAGIVRITAERLLAETGVEAPQLLAFFGPAVRACSYEIAADLHGSFRKLYPQIVGDEPVLDLTTVNIHQLITSGLDPDNIYDLGLCTYCHYDLFFSYRREQVTGRQAAIAMIL